MSARAGFSSAPLGYASRRTFQNVRRGSPHAGGAEIELWKRHNRFSRAENNAWLSAAEDHERATKKPGKRNGALGDIGMKVLRLLLRLRGKLDGRLDPSYAWIAQQARIARSSVGKALARLKAAGFLDWMRRSEPVEDPEPGGQYVKQTTNAFILKATGAAADMIRRLLRRPTEAMLRVGIERERAAKAARPAAESISEIADEGLRALLEDLAQGVRDEEEGENPPSGLNPPLKGSKG
ncbi:hypothetical protein M9978_02235 [Sphingomonas sp. MG17]|uniref:Uncharacterized protein n=1 Tax=Sphingomonas tagetis TaxID=2949092 RepID=A0A9X2KJ99_9SPHN|nr:hypothetical protein [Sphingomonas tagetis]MCP3729234.1 hypothetical protein [Sphingomonas tagetis]